MKNTLLSFEWKSLPRLVASFFAIFFLVVNTACSSSAVSDQVTQPNPDNLTSGKSTNLYDPLTTPKGGMNNYSDVDPRVDTSRSDAKAKRLINKASSNKPANPIKEVRKELDKKGPQERVEDLSKNLSRSAQENFDQVSETAQKDFGNLQKNVKSFKSDVKSAANDMGKNVQDKTDDIKNTAQKTADAVVNKAERDKSKI
jgi:hypothetical protein